VQIGSIGFVIAAVIWAIASPKAAAVPWHLGAAHDRECSGQVDHRPVAPISGLPVYVAAAALGEREALYYLIVAISCVLAAHQQMRSCWDFGWRSAPVRNSSRCAAARARLAWCAEPQSAGFCRRHKHLWYTAIVTSTELR